jgi:phospholipase C
MHYKGNLRRLLAATVCAVLLFQQARIARAEDRDPKTATPIKHLVIIFQENESFDHYFGTYPVAANNSSEEPKFKAKPNTPTVNGLTGTLLTYNPNLNPLNNSTANNSVAANPFRLSRAQAATADQDHDYGPEQMAFDHGLMDLFPFSVGGAGTPPEPPPSLVETTALTMGYYDGNTVTALWNYAQRFALNDNSFGTTFGPSTVGAINLISGQTNGVTEDLNPGGGTISDGHGGLTVIGDPDPVGDVCSTTSGETSRLGGANIGDLLTAKGIKWGWFEGGFNLTLVNKNGTTGCQRSTTSAITDVEESDYIPHHQPFQYYASTANPTHARPTSVALIGTSEDGANHQYDFNDFRDAVNAGDFPAVSFIKAPGYQDGHPGYSDPIDEQKFVVSLINFLQGQPEWAHTAIVISWDDSDGWYDHQMGPILNQSTTTADALTGTGSCGDGTNALPGVKPATTHAQGRCGYGPRLPMVVISPYARRNFVDHTLTSQTSTIRFIEDNWLGGERIGQGSFDAVANSIATMFDFISAPRLAPLILNSNTGEVVR